MQKIDNLVKIPLDEILIKNGYCIKRNKSSQRYKVLTNDNDDTVIISRLANGHYLYFNPNDDTDKGNIYNFCKNRGVRANNLTNGLQREELEKIRENRMALAPQDTFKNQEIIKTFNDFKNIEDDTFLHKKRKIDLNIIKKYNIKQDAKQNAIIPTYTIKKSKYSNIKTTLTIHTGYIAYLSSPITKDKENRPYNKPIKQLCYGKKGLEILKSLDSPRSLKQFKNIIISESSIDSLSYCELKGFEPKETLLCATNGQVCTSQMEIFQYLAQNANGAKFYLAFDNDPKGKDFQRLVQKAIPQAKAITPILKDFNDDLYVVKSIGLNTQNLTKETLEKPFKQLAKDLEYLSKKFSILLPSVKQKKFKELQSEKTKKLLEVFPKLQNLVDTEKIHANLEEINSKFLKENCRAR